MRAQHERELELVKNQAKNDFLNLQDRCESALRDINRTHSMQINEKD
jgi:hypothetical protein